MKRLYTITFLLILLSSYITAQTTTPKNRYYIDAATGRDVILGSPSKSSLPGFLLLPDDNSATAYFRYQNFITDKWGIFASVHIKNDSYADYAELPAAIIPDPNKYHIINDYADRATKSNEVYLVGAQYRYEFKRFNIQPYLGLGVSTFSTNRYSYEYKGIGNNEVFESDYGFNKQNLVSFTMSPGINIVWKFSTQLHLFADVNYIHNFTSFEAVHSVKDLYTGNYTTKDKESARMAGLLSFKVGLSLPLWFNKKKSQAD